jgi:hypothetical protein
MEGNMSSGPASTEAAFGVATPFSPNESGPADTMRPDRDRYPSVAQNDAWSGERASAHEVITPLADNEAGPNDIMLQRQGHRFDTAMSARSMANPQTAWSDNEAGPSTYNEDMLAHRQQVAEVERARIAAAEWNARIAAAPVTAPDTNALTEPLGGTSGLTPRGSNERYVDPSQQSSMSEPFSQPALTEPTQRSALPAASDSQPDVRGDAATPSEVDRTSALRQEPDYSLPVTEYNTVGILEMPAEPGEYTVWSVEPLNPGADIATGDTVYIPDGSQVVFLSDFDRPRSPAGKAEQSASVDDDTTGASGPSSL